MGISWALTVRGDRPYSGSDAKADCFELAQFVHDGIYFLGVRSLGVEERLGVVQDDEHFLGGKEWP